MDIAEIEERLSRPTPAVIELMAAVEGDILILGAGGKMGPSLARMARRASDAARVERRIVAVSRFTNSTAEAELNAAGVETISCDMLDPAQLEALPNAPNVVFMAGMKFGSTGNELLTWALNVELPGLISRRFPGSRFAVFSTGNVYPRVPVAGGGSLETDVPAPIGEYAMSCLGRERIFEHHSISERIPISIIRLTYALEMRYGVLIDIGTSVFRGEPIDLTMGSFCAIWQGDANAMALQSLMLASTPPFVVNITGPELLSVRQIALRFGDLFNRPPIFTGTESGMALISHTRKAMELFGPPTASIDQVILWTAEWIRQGGKTLNKPTHFGTIDGRF